MPLHHYASLGLSMMPSCPVRSLLLISPQTYNYHKILLEACGHAGIDVVWLDERPSSSFFSKLISRTLNNLARKLSVSHYLARLGEIKSSGFSPSHILVIKGESVDPSIVSYMRSAFPGAKFVLYFWDSTKNLPGYLSLVKLFDVVASFDSLDCTSFGWHYQPLFCGNPAVSDNTQISGNGRLVYDWSFVGAVHSDRLVVLDKLVESSRSINSFFAYIYFPSLLHFLISFARFPRAFLRLMKYFHSSPLPPSSLGSIYAQSRCILDIHHPSQSGLTMRTIESIMSGIKLATTNASIFNDLFYDKSRVLIIDRMSPVIPFDFLDDIAHPLPDSISNSFKPASWLLTLLSLSATGVN